MTTWIHLIAMCLCLLAAHHQLPAVTAQHFHRRGKVTYGTHLLGHIRNRTDFILGVSLKPDQLGSGDHLCVRPNMNAVVPELQMKWDPIEKNGPGQWDFADTDLTFRWASVHGKLVRGHAGLWDQALPGWVQALQSDPKAMEQAIYQHVYGVVKRYGASMVSFDVVNEPFNYDGSGTFKSSPFYQALGVKAFVVAFQAAMDAREETASKVKLYLNEMNVEGAHAQGSTGKMQAFLELLSQLKKAGVTVDGVGLQCHLQIDKIPSDFPETIDQFVKLGYEVTLTELDVRIPDGDNSLDTLEAQADVYAWVYKSYAGCKGVVRWGFDDDHSWVPETISGYGRATMFGSNCQLKPMIIKKVIAVLQQY